MKKPTDMELMLFADGELDESRHHEVERFLASDAASRDKLAGLRVVGAFVREQGEGELPTLNIADAVLLKLTEEGRSTRVPADNVIPLQGRRHQAPKSEREAPASGLFGRTSRAVYYFAGAAIAAAAAMSLWVQVDPQMPALPPTTAIVPGAQAVPGPAAALPADTAPVAALEPEVGVEVAAIDFGTRTGAIFYVQGNEAATGSTTTVVWVNDSGEE